MAREGGQAREAARVAPQGGGDVVRGRIGPRPLTVSPRPATRAGMNVLLIGSGGREHALAAAIRLSPRLGTLYAAPGNPGIAAIAECVVLDVEDHSAVVRFCRVMAVDLVVVGPEIPLVAGLADDLRAAGIATFGPSATAARLEGSKAFTKAVCDEAGIPTAAWSSHDSLDDALRAVGERGAPIVVKADGLAAGKGVTVANSVEEAEAAIHAIFAGGPATVVVEDVLEGEEASLFALCDGTHAVPLPPCRDHKRVGEGDTGPNTGGMGAICPAMTPPGTTGRAMTEIVEPALRIMAERETPFRGVLYAGLMVRDGEPSLIEFNVRFGDPEAQALLPLLGESTLDLLHAAATGGLAGVEPPVIDGATCAVTLASEGYPADPVTGRPIEGVDDAEAIEGVRVFHAGTRRDGDRLVTSGGRVLTVVGMGREPTEARERAYRGVAAIRFEGMQFRRDIGGPIAGRDSVMPDA